VDASPGAQERAVARDRLLAERAAAQAQLTELTAGVAAIVAASEGSNNDDEHDPEGSTIAFERAQLVALLDSARHTLGEIDSALERVDAGTYGRCEVCGKQISRERLAARAAARLCLTCASARRCG
jgi:DnaK suppressor protein